MQKSITAHSLQEKRNHDFTYDVPSICPMCKIAMDPRPLCAFYVPPNEDPDAYSVFILFFCQQCEKCFLAHCYANYTSVTYSTLYPSDRQETSFSQCIKDLSPDFVNVYNQAFQADNTGLDKICGMGYRKSLEVLIKDYAISINPDDEEKIEMSHLSPCIDNYVDDDQIKSLAKAAVWLGNDEAHYFKKHPDYDLETLKAFLGSVVSSIESRINFRKAEVLLNK